MSHSTLLRQRLLLEELHRLRRPSDHERYVETFRRCALDPNPHQVEAVAFALQRLPYGGALLCDEVGLGKTIETGLLLTQLRAEGKTRVLILVPLSLARQWQVELQDLFGLKATVLSPSNLEHHRKPGLYLAGREFASSPKWMPQLRERGPWDLIVVDEAHELLSSLHQRFSKRGGGYNPDPKKGPAKRAAALRSLLQEAPALLLTATPLQNSLLELWSLVHYVDREGRVLGTLGDFCVLFTKNDGKALQEGTEEDLRQRLASVMARTLRSQAQPFLRVPFRARRCETVNFHMQAAEKELYEAVSAWLRGRQAVYPSRARHTIATGLRKRLGSSVEALAASLEPMRQRLAEGESDEPLDHELVLEDERQLARFEELARQALGGEPPKLEKLGELVDRIRDRAVAGVASDKVVIFTESRPTMETVRAYLRQRGEAVTCFSGTNDSPDANRALEVWEREVGVHLDPDQHPDRSSAVRAALVHEFRTRTRIFIATEAGGKGLNLQFCNCLVNYDLPWNPQRIEQRIGRVHRYGQQHDVAVVNFINLDNAGEQRVYSILKDKLELFTGLFGASDLILGTLASVLDFERRIHDLLDSCRTAAEVQREFDRLELELDEHERRLREARLSRARDLLAGLDADVQARLRLTAESLPQAMSRRDETLLAVLECEAPVRLLPAEGPRQPFEWQGKRYHLGPPDPSQAMGEPLYLDHPLLRQRWERPVEGVYGLAGAGATWTVYRVRLEGLETEERLLVLGPEGLLELLAQGPELTRLSQPLTDPPELNGELHRLQAEREAEQRFELARKLALLNSRKLDAQRLLEAQEAELLRRLEEAGRKLRGAVSPQAVASANSRRRKLAAELAALRSAREERLARAAREFAREAQQLQEQRFVKVSVQALFQLQGDELRLVLQT